LRAGREGGGRGVGGGSGSEITTGEDKVTKRGRKYGGKIIVVPKKELGHNYKGVERGGGSPP
jgi:hypothetical protein